MEDDLAMYPFYVIPSLLECYSSKTEEEKLEDELTYNKYQELISGLPMDQGRIVFPLHNYRGYWLARDYLRGALVARERFTGRSDDIVLASSPKSGTTWMKALLYAAIHRREGLEKVRSTLLAMNPHELFPFFEGQFTGKVTPNLDMLSSPRLFNTHLPYSLLPVSSRGCKIIYICREPKDNFVLWWHYRNAIVPKRVGSPLSLDDAFELYCKGMFPWGPIWEHMLEYWNEHVYDSHKVLFLRYEDVKGDVTFCIKKMAEFVGFPFEDEEVKRGIVEDIVRLCSFESLKNMEVNKNGCMGEGENAYENKVFFRKGKVGDWGSLLTKEMAEKLDMITKEKLLDSGLSFKRCTLRD